MRKNTFQFVFARQSFFPKIDLPMRERRGSSRDDRAAFRECRVPAVRLIGALYGICPTSRRRGPGAEAGEKGAARTEDSRRRRGRRMRATTPMLRRQPRRTVSFSIAAFRGWWLMSVRHGQAFRRRESRRSRARPRARHPLLESRVRGPRPANRPTPSLRRR